VHQCSNGSILESSTTPSNESASGNKSTQGNTVLIQCMFHITRACAQLVVLDIGQPEMQYRRCSCARSRRSNGISLQYSHHHHQQYEALLSGEQVDTLLTSTREPNKRTTSTHSSMAPTNLGSNARVANIHGGPRCCGCKQQQSTQMCVQAAAEEGIESPHASSKATKLPPRYRAIINNRSMTFTRESTLTEVASERCGERYFIIIGR